MKPVDPNAPTDSMSLLLASGGIDSATAMAMAVAEGGRVELLFVDYGQAAAGAEARASAAVAEHFGVKRRMANLTGASSFASGEIRGRNAFLVHTALLAFDAPVGSIVLGIHAGTGYRDCSPLFVDQMQASLDFHTGGAISLAAPFVGMQKPDVCTLARDLGVPIGATYSCESGDTPCGTCRSCRDREAFVEGA